MSASGLDAELESVPGEVISFPSSDSECCDAGVEAVLGLYNLGDSPAR